MKPRVVSIGDAVLVSTEMRPGAHLVRVLPPGPLTLRPYHGLIGVIEEEEGQLLHVVGMHGQTLSPKQWIRGRDALFPQAVAVTFERADRGTGEIVRTPRLPLPPVKLQIDRHPDTAY